MYSSKLKITYFLLIHFERFGHDSHFMVRYKPWSLLTGQAMEKSNGHAMIMEGLPWIMDHWRAAMTFRHHGKPTMASITADWQALEKTYFSVWRFADAGACLNCDFKCSFYTEQLLLSLAVPGRSWNKLLISSSHTNMWCCKVKLIDACRINRRFTLNYI